MFQEINKSLLIHLSSLWKYTFFENIVNIFVDFPIFFLPIFLVWAWMYYSYNTKIFNYYIKFTNLRSKSDIKSIKDQILTKIITKKQNLLLIFYWTILAISITLLVQQIIVIERPETVIEWVWKLLIKHLPDASFPSDHATVSVAFLTWLFLAWYKKTWYIFLPLVILMNLSRVIAWIHWPFDIIVWVIIWIISSFVSFKVFKKSKFVKKLNQFIIKILSYIRL